MKDRLYIKLFLLLTLLYVAVTFMSPADPTVLQRYSITEIQAKLLTLTVVLPLVAIWLTALYGILKFRNYARVIDGTKEGPSFKKISQSLSVLAFSLPLIAAMNACVNKIIQNRPDLLQSATIFRNYMNLLLPGIGLLLLAQGSIQLVSLLKNKKTISGYSKFSLVGVIVVTSIYTWLITTRPFGATGDSAYYMPNWLVISTIAIPYLYIWCRGIQAATNIFLYRQNVRGVVYKKSLDYLAKGIVTIIMLSILVQLVTTLATKLNRLNLTPILLIVYLIIAMNALGYGLLARGARGLKRIEEV